MNRTLIILILLALVFSTCEMPDRDNPWDEKATIDGIKGLDTLLEELKAGRMISNANRTKIQAVIDALEALLSMDEPSNDTQNAEKSLDVIDDIDPNLYQSILSEIQKYK